MIKSDNINEINLIQNDNNNANLELKKSKNLVHDMQIPYPNEAQNKSEAFEHLQNDEPNEKNYVDVDIVTECTFKIIKAPPTNIIKKSNFDNDDSPLTDKQESEIFINNFNKYDDSVRLNIGDSETKILSKDDAYTKKEFQKVTIVCDDFINMDKLIELGSTNFNYDLQNEYPKEDYQDDADDQYKDRNYKINCDLICDNEVATINQLDYEESDLDEYLLAHHSCYSDEDYVKNYRCAFTSKYESEYDDKYCDIVDEAMCVDNKKLWSRLDGVSMKNDILEYAQFKSSTTGLAQALQPFSMRYNYFVLEILNEGMRCAIAIGATKRNYPSNQHPGWSKGSIAYHADDGKIFHGEGVGDPFGPICKKGDQMGCGIIFPRNYKPRLDATLFDTQGSSTASDEDEDLDSTILPQSKRPKKAWNDLPMEVYNPDIMPRRDDYNIENDDQDNDDYDYGDDDDDKEDEDQINLEEEEGTQVEVYFTRNGQMVGSKWTRIPKGGFFPTIGLLSHKEKVKVFLRPLTG